MTKRKMTCPKCGDEMNHHAEKLIYSTETSDARTIDPFLGGLIEENHSCPSCGAIAVRVGD